MKRLLKAIGRFLGIHFAPDNHVTPVLRMGRYHRIEGPGFCWIIPLIEQTLPPVKTSLHVGNFYFNEVLSRDNVPFIVQMTVLFTFDPISTAKKVSAVLLRAGNDLLRVIVEEYTSQSLRRQVARFSAEELSGREPMSTIERNLTRSLAAEMRVLGIAPLPSGGVLIKEIIAPEKFKRGVLNARRLEALLQALTRYPVGSNLIQQALQAGFVTGLEDLQGDLTLISTLSPLEGAYPNLPADIHRLLMANEQKQNGRNGH